MTTITSTALSLIAGHDDLTTAIENVTSEQSASNRPVQSVALPDFTELALAGEPFPEDVTSAEEERLRALRNQSAKGALLKTAKKELERRRTEAVRQGSDKALAYLDDELESLVSDVVDIADELGSLGNVQHILEKGTSAQIKAYREVKTLVDRYAGIRDAQIAITRQCVEPTQVRFIYEVGFLRNSLDDSEFWQGQRKSAYTTRASQDSYEHVVRYNDWLTPYLPAQYPYKRAVMPVTPDQYIAYLLDLCTNHELWVPSVSELLSAWEAANSAAQPVSYDRLKGMEESRQQYYAITKSTVDLTTGGKDGYRKIPKTDLLGSYMNYLSS